MIDSIKVDIKDHDKRVTALNLLESQSYIKEMVTYMNI